MTAMVPIGETLGMLFHFLFNYMFLFIVLPMAVLRFDKDDGLLDKVFISLTHATLFFIVVTHLLAGIRLLETLSLFALMFIAVLLYVRFLYRHEKNKPWFKWLQALFDLTEDGYRWKVELRKLGWRMRQSAGASGGKTIRFVRSNPFLIAAFVAIFAMAMAERFKHSFRHLHFASSDPYVHLHWAKNMSDMNMYADGVYPYGFESVLVSLYELFRLDMYQAIRFMGPWTALLISLSIVYFMRKVAGAGKWAVLITLALFFFSAATMVFDHAVLWRQFSALSMEYAAVFLLPGMVFFYQFFKRDKRAYLLLAAECLAIAVLTHPFTAVALALGYVAIGLAFAGKLFAGRTFIRTVGYMFVAGFVGLVPPLIGLLMGIPFHGSSIDYFRDGLETEESERWTGAVGAFLQDQPLIALLCIVATALLLVFGLRRLVVGARPLTDRSSHHATVVFASLLFMVMMATVYLSSDLGLPSVVPPDRQTVFLTLAVATLAGVTIHCLSGWMSVVKWRKRIQALVFIAVCLVVFFVPGQRMPSPLGYQQQYDEAFRAYLDIKEAYPAKTWNLVSTVDELGAVLEYGFHTEIWRFVQALSDPDVETIDFTTPHVFLFVEKIPLDVLGDSERPIAPEDADKPFPEAGEASPAEFYYVLNPDNRRILMAKAYYWAEKYRDVQADMGVYFETENFIIYEWYQSGEDVTIDKRRVGGG